MTTLNLTPFLANTQTEMAFLPKNTFSPFSGLTIPGTIHLISRLRFPSETFFAISYAGAIPIGIRDDKNPLESLSLLLALTFFSWSLVLSKREAE